MISVEHGPVREAQELVEASDAWPDNLDDVQIVAYGDLVPAPTTAPSSADKTGERPWPALQTGLVSGLTGRLWLLRARRILIHIGDGSVQPELHWHPQTGERSVL